MNAKYVNMFVLGAGASVDYGLPVWADLRDMLIEEIETNEKTIISSDVTTRFLNELKEIGPGKKYTTVDDMISRFEEGEDGIPEITAAVFQVVKSIFKSKAKTEDKGWIETFIEKNNLEILLNNKTNATSDFPTVFINFNYDTLLLSRIVQFFKNKYDCTPKRDRKEWRLNHGVESDFGERFKDCAQAIFHPHGILYLSEGDETRISPNTSCHPISNTFRNARTSGASSPVSNITVGIDNAISCHDTREPFTIL